MSAAISPHNENWMTNHECSSGCEPDTSIDIREDVDNAVIGKNLFAARDV